MHRTTPLQQAETMRKLVVHQFDPVIYPRLIFVVKGAGPDMEKKLDDAYRTPDDDHLSFDGADKCKAGVWNVMETSDRGKYGILIWLREKVDPGVVAHESVHAANNICIDCGIHFDARNDEHYAYLVGFIADCIWQTWTGKFKDKC